MKNFIRLIGIIAFAAVIVFSLTAAACGGNSSGGTTSSRSSTPTLDLLDFFFMSEEWFRDTPHDFRTNTYSVSSNKQANLKGAAIIIPATYEGKPVTVVDDFDGEDIVSITIPNGIIEIGSSAFAGCKSLTSVSIGNTVTTIGQAAFFNCKNLRSIAIPDSVIEIGGTAFYGCENITSITIGKNVSRIGTNAFNGCSFTSVIIPASVTILNAGAFGSNYGAVSGARPSTLTSVTFEGSNHYWDNRFSSYRVFDGDLDDKYRAGGAGTYTRPNDPDIRTWTKQ